MTSRPLTLHEAAELMGKSVQTLRRKIKQGKLDVSRVKTPQGFQYLVAYEELVKRGFVQGKMLPESIVEKSDGALVLEEKEELTTQVDKLTSQSELKVQEKAENEMFDRQTDEWVKDLKAIIKAHHQEKMVLIYLLEKLQEELKVARQPKLSRWQRFWLAVGPKKGLDSDHETLR